jgi:hypothetical protein
MRAGSAAPSARAVCAVGELHGEVVWGLGRVDRASTELLFVHAYLATEYGLVLRIAAKEAWLTR